MSTNVGLVYLPHTTMHFSIFCAEILVWKNNQTMHYFPPHITTASALPGKTWKYITSFHSNAVLLLSRLQPFIAGFLQTYWLATHTHAAVWLPKSSSQRCSSLGCWGHSSGEVSWSLTPPFSTNIAISETKGPQGWRAIPTQWRKASNILILTLAAFLFSS